MSNDEKGTGHHFITNFACPYSTLCSGYWASFCVTLTTRSRSKVNLRMNVYHGTGKHSLSQSPAMNFDTSAVSFKALHGQISINNVALTTINRMYSLNYSLYTSM